MNTTDELLALDHIRRKRADNNDLWMRIVRIALKHAPDEIKPIMRDIGANDQDINLMWQRLSA